jgi:hypothetical protein
MTRHEDHQSDWETWMMHALMHLFEAAQWLAPTGQIEATEHETDPHRLDIEIWKPGRGDGTTVRLIITVTEQPS